MIDGGGELGKGVEVGDLLFDGLAVRLTEHLDVVGPFLGGFVQAS
jgi:hypothetical protein